MTSPGRQVALVTGGAGGIGSAVCARLAADGLHVVVAHHSGTEAAADLAAKIVADGGSADTARGDITDPAAVTTLFDEVVARHGRVDVVVNNAGTMIPTPLATAEDALYDRVFDVNVRGALAVLRESARRLADGGAVITTSSTIVDEAIPGSALYAGAKAAVELFSTVAAKELGPRGITVNSLRVGPTVPGMFSQAPPERQAAKAAASPFGRLGRPEDVANVVSFLAGPQGRWITGQVITVDGGAT